MGSTTPALPASSAASLQLTHPTPAERTRIWTLTHPMWGPALTEAEYLRREEYLTTIPVAKAGGITHWILTDSCRPDEKRPVLSSCESLRKRAWLCRADGGADGPRVEEVVAHGIASVFTDPEFRGRGYAGRMMTELGRALRTWQAGGTGRRDAGSARGGQSAFSVLYSDIGKKFYAARGWEPFESTHAAFPPVPRGEQDTSSSDAGAKAIGYHEMAEMCAVDEKLLQAEMLRRAGAAAADKGAKRTFVALVPDLDALLWHLMREDFMTKSIFGKTPSVKGAVYGEPGRRLWAVWTRGYYGGLQKMEGNNLHILRFVIEDESSPEDYLVQGFRSIIQIAEAEAAEWHSQDVQLWNPSAQMMSIIEKSGLDHSMVTREDDSIASLSWYGDGAKEDVEWVANEKFGWC